MHRKNTMDKVHPLALERVALRELAQNHPHPIVGQRSQFLELRLDLHTPSNQAGRTPIVDMGLAQALALQELALECPHK